MVVDLGQNSFLHQVLVGLDPKHINVEEFVFVIIDIRIRRALDLMIIDAESSGESFGEKRLAGSQIALQEKNFMVLG